MDSPEYFISWGSERYVPLHRFKDLQLPRHDLIRYYGEVLETAQTFTQHFSKQPLKSYDMERSLKKNMGCDPLCLDEETDSTSISWLDIVRHGDFQEQSEGYHCFIQGKVFFHDQQLQNRVDFCRRHALHISNSGPSHQEVRREVEVTQEILSDISNELSHIPKCLYFPLPQAFASGYLTGADTRGLENLEQTMKMRLSYLLSLLDPGIISRTPSRSASGLEDSPDDDRNGQVAVSLDSSPEDSSEDESGESDSEDDESEDDESEDDESEDDESEDDESEDDNTEDEGPDEEGPNDEGPEDEGLEDEGTENDDHEHYSRQQRITNSDNGGNVATDDGTVVSLNLLSSRSPYSMPLIAEDGNGISTGRASMLEETGNAVSVNPMASNGSLSISSPMENKNGVPIDSVSSQNGPQMNLHVPLPESLAHDGLDTLIESEGPPRAVKRRKFNNLLKRQKKPPKSNRISSYEERSIAIAWTKAWIEAHSGEKWSQRALAREYAIKFGGNRSYNTLKTWIDKRENPQPKSHIVVLKIPIPYLREALWNDHSS
ncbi:hypothetical protein N7447_002367 [Penicillium robsamsonii]|uniref:uncharacterized protein n=1 Tax=Penicillium robsamsonii TaxID=1792511 RepID=UPI0025478DFB|nr:uncharacterized protein N7447_002367 [Penicillium robsamsonii]KAJ5836341.1 hypothetical protein N7447_002367 [Penicillium robsamsonii]